MNRLLILASLLLAAISCSKEGAEPTKPNTETGTVVTLTASLTDAVTRVSAETSSDDNWTFTWDEEDKISGWYTDCSAVTEFETETYDPQSSTFTGVVMDEKEYRFIYPYEVASVAGNMCTIDISDQTGGEELDKTYMINDTPIASSSLTGGTVSNLSMRHLGAFMVVDVYLGNFEADKTYRLKGVKYSSTDGVICTSAQIDMTKEIDELYTSISSGTVTADMDVEFTTSTDKPDYLQAITNLNILPSTIEVDQTATIELTIGVYDSEADSATLLESFTSSVTLSNNSGAALPFARATHNFTYITVDISQKIEITGATINGWGKVVEGDDLMLAALPDIAYNETTNTYEITSANGMRAFADLVSGFDCSASDLTYSGDDSYFDFGTYNNLINGKLLKDIDLGGIDNEGNGVAENEWTAIKGSVDYPFGGTFDGDGHVISGLYINQSDSNYQGLFGYIESATIKNLGVSGSVTGKLHIGGIVGSMNSSVVSNCYNACSVDGSVSVGGIIGYSYSSSVKNCYNIGSVVAIEIAGGVVGEAIYGSISYCYNIGAVKEEDVYLDNTGGILGYWSSSDTNYFEISYCYYDKDVVTDVNGAAYGKDDGTNYCGLSTEMMQGDATTEGSLLYYLTNENYGNSSDWTADTENINNGYPILVEN